MSKEPSKLDALRALGPGGLARQFGAGDDPAARRKAAKALLGAVRPALTDKEIARNFTERVGKIEAQEAADLRRLVEELRVDVAWQAGQITQMSGLILGMGVELAELKRSSTPSTRDASTVDTASSSSTVASTVASTDGDRRRALKTERMRRYRERKKAGETT